MTAALIVTCARCLRDYDEGDQRARYASGDWWCTDEADCDQHMHAEGDPAMTHDPHGGNPEQILYDGCGECGQRAANRSHGIENLDPETFAAAWSRAAARGREGLGGISEAEASLLDLMWAVQVQLERRGVPLGEVPCGF